MGTRLGRLGLPARTGRRRRPAVGTGLGAPARLPDQGRAVLRSDRSPAEETDQAAGYRHLLVLLALGIDEALRSLATPTPYFAPANVDNVLKWGMDCPDAAYTGAAIRATPPIVVRGQRYTVRYLGFQVMSGIENSGNVVADDLEHRPRRTLRDRAVGHRAPGQLDGRCPTGRSSLVVRQFFYDWDRGDGGRAVHRVHRPPARLGRAAVPEPLSAGGVARQLVALGAFLEASIAFWLDVEEAGRAQGVNFFRRPPPSPPWGRRPRT